MNNHDEPLTRKEEEDRMTHVDSLGAGLLLLLQLVSLPGTMSVGVVPSTTRM